MQALMKKPPIDNGLRVLVISCPEEKYESLVEFLRKNDCTMDDEGGIPASVVYPEHRSARPALQGFADAG